MHGLGTEYSSSLLSDANGFRNPASINVRKGNAGATHGRDSRDRQCFFCFLMVLFLWVCIWSELGKVPSALKVLFMRVDMSTKIDCKGISMSTTWKRVQNKLTLMDDACVHTRCAKTLFALVQALVDDIKLNSTAGQGTQKTLACVRCLFSTGEDKWMKFLWDLGENSKPRPQSWCSGKATAHRVCSRNNVVLSLHTANEAPDFVRVLGMVTAAVRTVVTNYPKN